jgi:hypothetical protein
VRTIDPSFVPPAASAASDATAAAAASAPSSAPAASPLTPPVASAEASSPSPPSPSDGAGLRNRRTGASAAARGGPVAIRAIEVGAFFCLELSTQLTKQKPTLFILFFCLSLFSLACVLTSQQCPQTSSFLGCFRSASLFLYSLLSRAHILLLQH